jgi:hypothetical protein
MLHIPKQNERTTAGLDTPLSGPLPMSLLPPLLCLNPAATAHSVNVGLIDMHEVTTLAHFVGANGSEVTNIAKANSHTTTIPTAVNVCEIDDGG